MHIHITQELQKKQQKNKNKKQRKNKKTHAWWKSSIEHDADARKDRKIAKTATGLKARMSDPSRSSYPQNAVQLSA